jgi:hypothetical protein
MLRNRILSSFLLGSRVIMSMLIYNKCDSIYQAYKPLQINVFYEISI